MSAGWDVGNWVRMMDGGHSLKPEGFATRESPGLVVALSYAADNDRLKIEVGRESDGLEPPAARCRASDSSRYDTGEHYARRRAVCKGLLIG